MICSKCGKAFDTCRINSVNTAEMPEIKEKVKDGSLFVCKCPFCGEIVLDNSDFLYHDPSSRILIVLSQRQMSSPGMDGYVCRRVSSVGELVEKIKIFDAGLDDIAVEICKYVTSQELGKDVEYKFYGIEGADSEIILTYPEKGEMQMIAIGQNVYSDAVGILSRSPELKKMASGLVKIDQDWLSQFLR